MVSSLLQNKQINFLNCGEEKKKMMSHTLQKYTCSHLPPGVCSHVYNLDCICSVFTYVSGKVTFTTLQ